LKGRKSAIRGQKINRRMALKNSISAKALRNRLCRLNGGNRTIAFQQSLFLNAFALIEFFKAILRLILDNRHRYDQPVTNQATQGAEA
jgi:hypothetical protein